MGVRIAGFVFVSAQTIFSKQIGSFAWIRTGLKNINICLLSMSFL